MSALRQSYRYLRRVVRTIRGEEAWLCVQQQINRVVIGNEGASWCVSPDGLSGTSVVYSFGVGEDVSFDLQLIRGWGSCIHAFDPTPRSMQWVQSQALPAQFRFHQYGLAGVDGIRRFSPPQNPNHVSHTLLSRPSLGVPVELPVHRLGTIMNMLGHKNVDLLKMDIEGAEYEVIDDLIACGIRPKQLLVEFHHRWREVGFERTLVSVQSLNRAGYKIFHVSASGEEFSFRLDS